MHASKYLLSKPNTLPFLPGLLCAELGLKEEVMLSHVPRPEFWRPVHLTLVRRSHEVTICPSQPLATVGPAPRRAGEGPRVTDERSAGTNGPLEVQSALQSK